MNGFVGIGRGWNVFFVSYGLFLVTFISFLGSSCSDDRELLGPEGDRPKSLGPVFRRNDCGSCHGKLGQGGGIGPSIRGACQTRGKGKVRDVLLRGKGNMPSFPGIANDPRQVDQLCNELGYNEKQR
ncbi:c-type cytochrome [Pasteuria penetrans]|uniref:c-type cytochrome n=1 Tax=Pasteuria penetrans TaxID=86005 RepID=UPI000FAF6D27